MSAHLSVYPTSGSHISTFDSCESLGLISNMNEIMWYLPLPGLVHLHKAFQFICVASDNWVAGFFFIAQHYSVVYLDHIFFTHLSADWPLSCPHLQVIVNSIANKDGRPWFLQVLSSPQMYAKDWGCWVIRFFRFLFIYFFYVDNV